MPARSLRETRPSVQALTLGTARLADARVRLLAGDHVLHHQPLVGDDDEEDVERHAGAEQRAHVHVGRTRAEHLRQPVGDTADGGQIEIAWNKPELLVNPDLAGSTGWTSNSGWESWPGGIELEGNTLSPATTPAYIEQTIATLANASYSVSLS